jgi:hypothetical protein
MNGKWTTVLATVLITAIITAIFMRVLSDLRRADDWQWMEDAVKVPGGTALNEIAADLDRGRYGIARSKLRALRTQWDTFEREDAFQGKGLGYLREAFAQIAADTGNPETGGEPVGPGTTSQPSCGSASSPR